MSKEMIELIYLSFGFYIVPATILSGIVYILFRFRYKTSSWHWYDWATLIFPGIFYGSLLASDVDRMWGYHKTLGNLILESILLGILCGIVFFLRAIKGKNSPEQSSKYSLAATIMMVILSAIIYSLIPNFKE